MKAKIAVVAAAVLVLGARTAEGGWHVGFFGGYVVPLDASYAGAPGYGASFGLDLVRNLSLDVSLARWQSTVTASTSGLSAGTLAVVPIEVGLTARLPLAGAKLAAWAGFAGGYALPTFTYDSTAAAAWTAVGFSVAEKVQGGPCFSVMGGLDYALSPSASLGLEARYRMMKASGTWSMSDLHGGLTTSGTLDSLSFDALTVGLAVRIGI